MKLIIEIEVKHSWCFRSEVKVVTSRINTSMQISHDEDDLTPFMLDLTRNDSNILLNVAESVEKTISGFDLSTYPLIPIPKQVQEKEQQY